MSDGQEILGDLLKQDRDGTPENTLDFSLFFRIGRLTQLADYESKNLNCYGWFLTLCALYREVWPLMNTDEKQQGQDKQAALLPKFINLQQQILTTKKYIIDMALYMELQDYELLLRQVQYRRNLYLKMKQGSRLGFR